MPPQPSPTQVGNRRRGAQRGVPLVCIPSGRDQADNAVRVVQASAGVRLSSRAKPRAIRAAIPRVLADPDFHADAQRMQTAFNHDGAAQAADLLEDLADPR